MFSVEASQGPVHVLSPSADGRYTYPYTEFAEHETGAIVYENGNVYVYGLAQA